MVYCHSWLKVPRKRTLEMAIDKDHLNDLMRTMFHFQAKI